MVKSVFNGPFDGIDTSSYRLGLRMLARLKKLRYPKPLSVEHFDSLLRTNPDLVESYVFRSNQARLNNQPFLLVKWAYDTNHILPSDS